MKVVLLTVFSILVLGVKLSDSAGAGRAYPVLTENYVVELFRKINPKLVWDKSNYLVDLSGNYANCDYINTRGFVQVDRRHTDGSTIEAIVDNTEGAETHTKAVDSYIRPVMEKWTTTTYPENFRNQIAIATIFACSVRPGCSGRVSVACLFAPSHRGSLPIELSTTTTSRPNPPSTTTTTRRPPQPTVTGTQHALAFTPEQYKVAEGISGQVWDRSHLLENLSGYETSCAMVGQDTSSPYFPTATAIAEQRGMTVDGLIGYEKNEGSTPVALEKILQKMRNTDASRGSLRHYFSPGSAGKETGCSLIPDCIVPGRFGQQQEMYVVVVCLFEL